MLTTLEGFFFNSKHHYLALQSITHHFVVNYHNEIYNISEKAKHPQEKNMYIE